MKEDFKEFLMTYGWATLVGIIIIIMLVYFGVFSLNSSPILNSTNNYSYSPDNFCHHYNLSFNRNFNICFRIINDIFYEYPIIQINNSYYFDKK